MSRLIRTSSDHFGNIRIWTGSSSCLLCVVRFATRTFMCYYMEVNLRCHRAVVAKNPNLKKRIQRSSNAREGNQIPERNFKWINKLVSYHLVLIYFRHSCWRDLKLENRWSLSVWILLFRFVWFTFLFSPSKKECRFPFLATLYF